jgi:hypothetical protein
LAQIEVLGFYMLEKLIAQELAAPHKHLPIYKGWFVALLLAGTCALSVPFYFMLKIFKR